MSNKLLDIGDLIYLELIIDRRCTKCNAIIKANGNSRLCKVKNIEYGNVYYVVPCIHVDCDGESYMSSFRMDELNDLIRKNGK